MTGHGRLLHDGARKIVSEQMHFKFFEHHGRRSATQHIHLERGFDVVEE